MLEERFKLRHATIQTETEPGGDEEVCKSERMMIWAALTEEAVRELVSGFGLCWNVLYPLTVRLEAKAFYG